MVPKSHLPGFEPHRRRQTPTNTYAQSYKNSSKLAHKHRRRHKSWHEFEFTSMFRHQQSCYFASLTSCFLFYILQALLNWLQKAWNALPSLDIGLWPSNASLSQLMRRRHIHAVLCRRFPERCLILTHSTHIYNWISAHSRTRERGTGGWFLHRIAESWA